MTILDWFHTPWPYLYVGGIIAIVTAYMILEKKNDSSK